MDKAKRGRPRSDFLVRGKNAVNYVIYVLVGLITSVGQHLARGILFDKPVKWDHVMVFTLFCGLYILYIHTRELYWGDCNGRDDSTKVR